MKKIKLYLSSVNSPGTMTVTHTGNYCYSFKDYN